MMEVDSDSELDDVEVLSDLIVYGMKQLQLHQHTKLKGLETRLQSLESNINVEDAECQNAIQSLEVCLCREVSNMHTRLKDATEGLAELKASLEALELECQSR